MKTQMSLSVLLLITGLFIHYKGSAQEHSVESIVDKQLAAYNAHDIDKFISCYSKDVVTFMFPDKRYRHLSARITTLGKGIEKLRKTYTQMFAMTPNIKAEVTSRIIQGNYVIDKEKLTGIPRPPNDTSRKDITATAIYEIKDGLITKVWFINGD
jgi:hypothetical protein